MRAQFDPEDEVEAILRLAMRKQVARPDGDLQSRLLSAAQELGISEEAVREATEEYRATHQREQEMQAYRASLRADWTPHMLAFVCVNLMLLVIDLMGSPGRLWFFYPLMGWGIGFVIHTYMSLFMPIDPASGEFRRWAERRRNAEGSVQE